MKGLILSILQVQCDDTTTAEIETFIEKFPQSAIVVISDHTDYYNAIFKFANSFLELDDYMQHELTRKSIKINGKTLTQFEWSFTLSTRDVNVHVRGLADVEEHVSI